MRAAESASRLASLTAGEIASLAARPWADMPTWPQTAWETYAAGDARGVATRRVVLGCRDAAGTLMGWIAGIQVLDSAELEYILVDPRQRGKGIGRQLLRAWLRWCSEGNAAEAWLEVRAGNAAALALYRAEGFAEAARRSRYYADPVEDAVVMRWQGAENRSHADGEQAERG